MNQYTGVQIVRKYCAAAAIALAGGLVFLGAPARATIIWSLDTSQCSDSANTNGVCDAGFAARAIFQFSNIDANSIDVRITVENNSTISPAPLAAFGFSVLPGFFADADGVNDGAVA